MPSIPFLGTASLRTLALVGAAASGKTSLAEALLHRAGTIGAPGSLERGTTVSDFDPLERKFQHSLNASVMHLHHRDTRIHLIDTPGSPDFLGQSMTALEAVETAAVVVNAVAGIEPMTRRMMDWAARRGLCRLLVVNRIDAERVDLPALVERLQEAFGKECLPLNLPARGGTAVVDCFFHPSGEADFSSVEQAHRALVEQVVEVDAAFVERYLEDGDVDPSELHAPLEQALREGHLIPICFTSARHGAGLAELLDVLVQLMPNPAEGNPPRFLQGEGAQAHPVEARPDPDRHVLAHVFKVAIDPYVGKMGVFRIHQGTVTRDSLLYVGDGRKPFKVGHLFMLQGKEHVEIPRAGPGEICAVAKVDEIHFDAVLHDAAEDSRIHLQPLDFPIPVHGIAIEPVRRGDEQRLWDLLQKLVEEDPCLRIEHVASTNETVVYGLGELHLRVLLERLTEVHRCEVRTRPPRIAYRESITQPAEGHHRHKKQTGGAGQFGEVFLRVEPLPRGAGFEFVDQVKGGAIPSQFIPAVEKGVRQAMEAGVVAGYPMQDLRVIVHDGKHHPVDSKEVAFVTAGRKAFVDAALKARPIVLEPVVTLEVSAPEAHVGDITGDLAARRGQVNGTHASGDGSMTVLAQAPLAELASYQTRLNAMTGGQGRYTLAFSHYDVAPPGVQQQLASQFRMRDEE
ncbi:elongation factor G [Caldimonas thermodepolymerans]|uniref:Elongation factor G n=1 Tax=Caldimonas thermodepolymerans TaxID=215580 RepID=A0A2S5T2Z1_9BURK|nr:elongation factor G [Caldimonas thermodepolymerans]PPE69354.1 elongation factor G [Caldimonas thermodepolymerans]QPC31082.1 elongation factor G [Caldimonas thermodepolymerans]RDH96190.1 translation elongation factor 2 (EF-2/EF-G) [Caldimonas thermodepolymerans]TCP04110.1 translation elongation factor 2 (EF-2/EF-G) [Caldimonas thermodepolymerans]UZG43806.1 elongation factor G [Caldimonas thermodepolymerans]